MAVKIWYNGTDMNSFGPTPFVSISKESLRDQANVEKLGEKLKITIEGKIVAQKRGYSHNRGINQLLEDEKRLRHVFSQDGILTLECVADNTTSTFASSITNSKLTFDFFGQIKDSSNTQGSGIVCKVVGYQASKSADNWTQTVDYSIDLESFNPLTATLPAAQRYPIESYSDEWTIEPLEDSAFYSTNIVNNSSNVDVYSNVWPPASTNKLDNLIQFRISHKVGAVGKSAPTGLYPVGQTPGSTSPNFGHSAWFNAKRFVEQQLKRGQDDINHIFLAYNNTGFGQNSFSNENHTTDSKTADEYVYLYNHVRTVSMSEAAGTYDVTDTWLALNKPTSYTEDYSVEISQDSIFNVTAKINGSVQGLEMKKADYIHGNPTLASTALSDNGRSTINDITPNLNQSELNLQNMNETTIFGTKFTSAMHAWRNYVEPLLFVRTNTIASLLMDGQTTAYGTVGANPTSIVDPSTNKTGGNPTDTGAIIQYTDRGSITVNNPTYADGSCTLTDKKENIILGTQSVNKTVGMDPAKGTITYSAEYHSKGKQQLKGGYILNLSVQDSKAADVIAEMFVLGRKRGPLLQDTGSKTAKTRQLSLEIQTKYANGVHEYDMRYPGCPMYTGGVTYKDMMNIVDVFRPVLPDTWTPVKVSDAAAAAQTAGTTIQLITGAVCGQVYVKSDEESWNPIEGRFTKNISWTYDA